MLLYKTYQCKIKMRPSYKGQAIKESCKNIDGVILPLRVAWLMEDDDPYSGEYALVSAHPDSERLWDLAKITWIASGDVEVVPEEE